MVRGRSGWGVGGRGRELVCRYLRTEPGSHVDLGIGPQCGGGLVGERFKPHQVHHALVSGQRLGRGVGERGDSVQPHWAFVPREGRGNLVGDRLQAIHSQELPVRRQGRGSLRRERREPVEPEHPVVLSERGGRPCREFFQT